MVPYHTDVLRRKIGERKVPRTDSENEAAKAASDFDAWLFRPSIGILIFESFGNQAIGSLKSNVFVDLSLRR